jgi:hypothetical protein
MNQRLSGWFFGLLGLCGCLTTPAADSLYSSYVLPANAVVPELEADEAAGKRLALNAGVGPYIPLRTGYFNGAEVRYWDFGELESTTLKPMYIFRYQDENGEAATLGEAQGHPYLIDSIPGDESYTPLRRIYSVKINLKTYRGERITSVRALEDAVDMGLVSSPQPSMYFSNCLVTPRDVTMQTTDDGQTKTPKPAYYRGRIVQQFCAGDLYSMVGAIKLAEGRFEPGNAYQIRRRTEETFLDEELLDFDLNEDGDFVDTNTIFNDDVGTETYSGIWNSIEVEVDRGWKLGDAKQESDLFERSGDRLIAKEKVLDFRQSDVFLNRPMLWLNPSP